MPTNTRNDLIAGLAADLHPVRPMRARTGLALVAAAVGITVGTVLALAGLAPSVASGNFSFNFALANGLLLMLGIAAAAATVAMASPRVGAKYDGPKWAAAMAAIFPLAGAVLLYQGSGTSAAIDARQGWECALSGTAAATLIAGVLVAWLRRGAPVALTRAGTWLGVAAGALGSAAYGLSCPYETVQHLGIWHFLPVIICGAAGMVLVPRLVRW